MIRVQDLRVRDVMSDAVLTFHCNTPVELARERLKAAGFLGAPVVDDENGYLGTISLIDLLEPREGKDPTLREAMRADAPTCQEDQELAIACQRMVRKRAHSCVVLRERVPCGVVSAIDAARVLACLREQPGGWAFEPIVE